MLRIKWMMQVCTIAAGHTLLTSSGSTSRPSVPSDVPWLSRTGMPARLSTSLSAPGKLTVTQPARSSADTDRRQVPTLAHPEDIAI